MNTKLISYLVLFCWQITHISSQSRCPIIKLKYGMGNDCKYSQVHNPYKHPVRLYNPSYRNTTVTFESSYIPKLTNATIDVTAGYEVIMITFDRCKMTDIGENSMPYQRLIEVNIIHNNITEIKNDMFKNLKSLMVLNLNDNNITAIQAESFNDLTSLRVLNLSNNHITKMDSRYFSNAHFIESLDLSHNAIDELYPTSFENSMYLITLNLSHNAIKTVPNCFQYLNLLRNLSLSNNIIDNITHDSFKGLTSLSTLDLSSNAIASIAWSIFRELALNRIDISRNSLRDLDLVQLLKVASLKSIDIHGNNYKCSKLSDIVNKLRYTAISLNLGPELYVVNIHGIACTYDSEVIVANEKCPVVNDTCKEYFDALDVNLERLSGKIFVAVIIVIVILIIYMVLYIVKYLLWPAGRKVVQNVQSMNVLEPLFK